MKKIRLEKRQKDNFIKDIFHVKTQNSVERLKNPFEYSYPISHAKSSQNGATNIDIALA